MKAIDTQFDEIATHVAAGHFSQSEGFDQARRIARHLGAENAKLREALLSARGGLCAAAIKDGTLAMINEFLGDS